MTTSTSAGARAVTIGVPMYNAAPFIAATLRSLLAQDHDDVRIVVSDNASTDGSAEIAESLAREANEQERSGAHEPRVTVVRRAVNAGSIANFNGLLAGARTPFFMWAGAHDCFEPFYVRRCMELHARTPDAVLAYLRTRYIDVDDREIEVADDVLDTRGMPRAARYAAVVWGVRWYNLVHGVARTEPLRATGGFQNIWAPDHLLIADLSLRGHLVQGHDIGLLRREVRKPQADLDAHAARVLQDLDPASAAAQTARTRSERFRDLRDAHLALLDRSALSTAERAAAKATTLLAYFVHYGVPFTGAEKLRDVWRLAPQPFRERTLGALKRLTRRAPPR